MAACLRGGCVLATCSQTCATTATPRARARSARLRMFLAPRPPHPRAGCRLALGCAVCRPTPPLLLASASPARRSTCGPPGSTRSCRCPRSTRMPSWRRRRTPPASRSRPADVALLLARAKAEDVVAALEVDDTFGEPDADLRTASSCSGATGSRARRRGARQAGRCRRGGGTMATDARRHGGSPHRSLAGRPARHRRRRLRRHGGRARHPRRCTSPTLDDAEVDAYVATGEPLRVAGAFTLDGLGGALRLPASRATPSNVIGVPSPAAARAGARARRRLARPAHPRRRRLTPSFLVKTLLWFVELVRGHVRGAGIGLGLCSA